MGVLSFAVLDLAEGNDSVLLFGFFFLYVLRSEPGISTWKQLEE